VAASGGSATAELAAGTYTISATAYTGSGDSATAAASGEKTGVTVKSGETTEAALTLGPTAGGPNGFLSYAITIPPGASASDTAIITAAGGTVNNGELSLTAGPNTGTRELAPGFYKVRGVLSKGDRSRNKAEDVVIYSGLTSTLEKAYSDADLSGEDANPAPPITGGLGVTIGFMDYTGALVIGGDSGANTIVQGGTPGGLSLSAPAGYTDMAWYLDGVPLSTEGSVTLEAEDYEVRDHSVTFTGTRAGRPESQVIHFTVEPEPGNGGVTAADLIYHMATLPNGSPSDPTTIVFDSALDVTSNAWGTFIKDALKVYKRYVVLDLSACKAKNNRISGKASPSGNDFNVIEPASSGGDDPADYIVGIILPSSLTEIGDHAFSGLDTIRRVTIPERVTTIGNYAFSGSGLTSVTMPPGASALGTGIFAECAGLTSVVMPAGIGRIENATFRGCTSLSGISIPQTVTAIGNEAFRDCTSLSALTIPAGVTSIGGYALSGCTALTGITIPDGVATLGQNAFSSCEGLLSVTIPAGVSLISPGLFMGCRGLTSVTIAGPVTSIGANAFYNCQGLPGFTIPATVTSIGERAFGACSFTSITIPAGVTVIDMYAFENCYDLNTITFSGEGVPYVGSTQFPHNFYLSYQQQTTKAGTYTYSGGPLGSGTWTKH
jgi:hypothetical protein